MKDVVTIYDIARHCDVTPATVSKVFNNYHGINVKTKAKVLKAAQDMNYQPNIIARSLAKKSSKNLGVLLNIESKVWFKHHTFSEIINIIKAIMDEYHYDLTILPQDLNVGDSYYEHCLSRMIGGVFVFGNTMEPKIQELCKSNISMVAYDYYDDNVSGVTCDNYEAMRKMVEYIVEAGHQKIVYICGEDNYVTRRRVAAVVDVLKEHGLSAEDCIEQGAYYNAESCNAATERALKKQKPTAIIYPDDYCALYGMQRLRSLGLNVPNDVSVAGFDGTEIGQIMSPCLTTVKQNTAKIGRVIAEKLLKILNGKNEGADLTIINATFLEGESIKNLKT